MGGGGNDPWLCTDDLPLRMMVDYTEREERLREREREKFLYVLHHLRPYNTERRSIV